MAESGLAPPSRCCPGEPDGPDHAVGVEAGDDGGAPVGDAGGQGAGECGDGTAVGGGSRRGEVDHEGRALALDIGDDIALGVERGEDIASVVEAEVAGGGDGDLAVLAGLLGEVAEGVEARVFVADPEEHAVGGGGADHEGVGGLVLPGLHLADDAGGVVAEVELGVVPGAVLAELPDGLLSGGCVWGR